MEFQGKKKYWKTPGESFDGISWEERKKRKKKQFQGDTQFMKMDILNRRVGTISGKAHINIK